MAPANPGALTSDSAVIRRRCSDPNLELETRHAGFPSPEEAAAHGSDFKPYHFGTFRFPPSAYGDYAQAQFGVLDPEGWPVDVAVDWDEADHLRVTVEEDASRDETDPDLAIGVLPDA